MAARSTPTVPSRRRSARSAPFALALAGLALAVASAACTEGEALGHRLDPARLAAARAGEAGPEDTLRVPRRVERSGGLVVEILRDGEGPAIRTGSRVTLHYVARPAGSSQPFDSTRARGVPMSLEYGRTPLVPGLRRGLEGLAPGAQARIFVPANLAWGDSEEGPVPPGTNVVFEVEILQVRG